jgi:hypothetical protein
MGAVPVSLRNERCTPGAVTPRISGRSAPSPRENHNMDRRVLGSIDLVSSCTTRPPDAAPRSASVNTDEVAPSLSKRGPTRAPSFSAAVTRDVPVIHPATRSVVPRPASPPVRARLANVLHEKAIANENAREPLHSVFCCSLTVVLGQTSP